MIVTQLLKSEDQVKNANKLYYHKSLELGRGVPIKTLKKTQRGLIVYVTVDDSEDKTWPKDRGIIIIQNS